MIKVTCVINSNQISKTSTNGSKEMVGMFSHARIIKGVIVVISKGEVITLEEDEDSNKLEEMMVSSDS